MSQFVKPIADKLHTGWTGNNVGGSNLYQEVDETVASTDDFTSYDVTNNVPGNSDAPVIVWKVTSISNPNSGTATIRFRTYASQTGTYYVEVRSGYVDESNKGTLLGTSATQSHPGGGVFSTKTDSAVTFASGGTGSDLYFRLVGHNTSGSTNTMAITAIDADLPDADTTRNLSGTPDLLATTPITGSGTLTCSWKLTDGSPALTAMTGDGTMTVQQGSHTLTDGAPNLTAPTGDGTLLCRWTLSGSAALTPLTGTGVGTFGPISGSGVLFLRLVVTGLAIKFVEEKFFSWDTAWARAYEVWKEGRRILADATKYSDSFFILRSYTEFQGQTKQEIQALSRTVLDTLSALQPDESESPNSHFDSGDPGYTPIANEQTVSSPVADPVNAKGDVTYRPNLKTHVLRVRRA